MSTTSNIPQEINYAANKGVQQALYGEKRAEQEAQLFKDQTAPAIAQDTRNVTQDAQSHLYEHSQHPSMQKPTGDKTAAAEGYTQVAKDKVAQTAQYLEQHANTAKEQTGSTANQAREKAANASDQTSHATDNFQKEASAKTNQAVSQGKADVESVKAQSAGVIGTAKQYADAGLGTVRSYVQAGQEKVAPAQDTTGAPASGGITATLQSAASVALGTANLGLAYAQSALQTSPTSSTVPGNTSNKPITQSVKETIAPAVDKAAGTASQVQQSVQANVGPAVERAKQQLPDSPNPSATQSTNQRSQVEEDIDAVKGQLASTRLSEPPIGDAPRPYQDTSKPAIPKPSEPLY